MNCLINERIFAMTIYIQVKKIIHAHIPCVEYNTKMHTNIYDDLNIGSLDCIELIMAIEEEFSIEIPYEDVEKIATVGDISRYVEKRIR